MIVSTEMSLKQFMEEVKYRKYRSTDIENRVVVTLHIENIELTNHIEPTSLKSIEPALGNLCDYTPLFA